MIRLMIALLLLAGPARAHYPAPAWLMYGGYHTAEPVSRNDFRDADGMNCCGPDDCRRIGMGDYRIRANGIAEIRFRGVTHLLSSNSVFPSEDAFSWFCAEGRNAENPKSVTPQCLFVAPSYTERRGRE